MNEQEEIEAAEEGRPPKQARTEGAPSDGQATPEQQAAQQPAGPEASGAAGAAANAAAEAQVLADVDPALAQARRVLHPPFQASPFILIPLLTLLSNACKGTRSQLGVKVCF